jgi:hypothetical protein
MRSPFHVLGGEGEGDAEVEELLLLELLHRADGIHRALERVLHPADVLVGVPDAVEAHRSRTRTLGRSRRR